MGTDIHIVVERRVDGKWEAVKPDKARHEHQHIWGWTWFFPRNYDCFAVMADVRNGHGFAGVDTGNGFIPISEPRDFPDDASEIALKETGDHSFSWLTLAEIKAYDWTRRTKKRGTLTPEAYREWREHRGWPKGGWSGDVMGQKVLNISNAEMDTELERPTNDGYSRYTRVEWEAEYTDSCGHLLAFVKELEGLNLGKHDDVRLVFGFDS